MGSTMCQVVGVNKKQATVKEEQSMRGVVHRRYLSVNNACTEGGGGPTDQDEERRTRTSFAQSPSKNF
jgi:hypothetical protein